MKKTIIFSLSLIAATAANAAMITLNWTDGGPGTGNAEAGESAGVIPGAFINTVSGNATARNNTDVANLFDDSGAGSGVAVSSTGINTGGFTATDSTGYNTVFSNILMRNYGDTANGTITFTGLSGWLTANSATAYEVYFLSEREVNRYSGSISNGSETFFLANGGAGANPVGPFILGTDTTLAAATANANTANYIKFSATSTDSFTLDIQRGDGQGFIDVNGIQIVAVPEPSSSALLGLGGLAFILRRRK